MRRADAIAMAGGKRTWLCPREEDRARVLDNSGRIARARAIASGSIGLTVLYAAPAYGWWMVGLFALSALNNHTLDPRMRRSQVPEYHAAASIVVSQALLATAAALTGGPRSPILALVAVPTAFAPSRFRASVALMAAALAIALMLAATFGVNPSYTLHHPTTLLVAVVLVIGVAAATHAMGEAELHYRGTAILDPLTGLLNRQGLERRFIELAEQAHLTGDPISLLVCDLDHFKDVNDSHGHTTGDAVLRDVAYALRKQLRSFELIYRIGGEEFLVVLPGARLSDAKRLGQRLCEAARASTTHGLTVTVSVGVSTLAGKDVRFERLFEAADKALYRAKAEGRNGVVCACAEDQHEACADPAETSAGVDAQAA